MPRILCKHMHSTSGPDFSCGSMRDERFLKLLDNPSKYTHSTSGPDFSCGSMRDGRFLKLLDNSSKYTHSTSGPDFSCGSMRDGKILEVLSIAMHALTWIWWETLKESSVHYASNGKIL